MPKRTPSVEPAPPAKPVAPTDEWGIYDPAKAGMQALYARLGRPILRASARSVRLERRRGFRPERPNDGVGLAIEEAMLRAGIMEPKDDAAMPASAARAMRMALKGTRPPKAAVEPSPQPSAAEELAALDAPKRRTARRAKSAVAPDVAGASPPAITARAADVVDVEPARKTRAPRKTTARAKTEPPVVVVTPVTAGPPAPSPRRPRGPVPLAAWAHAVTEAPNPEARRGDKRGFWKSLFRMPADVALVEYAHGCRIHRLLIETSQDAPLLDLL